MCETSEGCFSYADTTALALLYVDRFPRLRSALLCRFPIVLVDEAQDTEDLQAALLDRLFLNGGSLQRFGDNRQAILSTTSTDDAPAAFPRVSNTSIPVLPINRSLRLSKSVAKLVTMVCHGNKEELGGNENTPDHPHSIFLFSKSTIGNVLPSFCQLVHQELGSSSDPSLVKAVAFNTVAKGPEATPSALSDYWSGFEPVQARAASIRSFADAIQRATTCVCNSGNLKDAQSALLLALTRSLAEEGIKEDGRTFTPIGLLRTLREKHSEAEAAVRRTLVELLREISQGHNLNPKNVAERFGKSVECLGWKKWSAANSYVQHVQPNVAPTAAKTGKAGQVFEWNNGDDKVVVGLGTIHSVKGETHRATLLLETKFHEHDVETMVRKGYFCGSNGNKAPGGRELKFLRTSYVAMSRPTHLLCVALLDDHVSEHSRSSLQNAGWTLKAI